MSININHLKKKIIYRSSYRGTKEMDFLLGSFIKKYLNLLTKKDLLAFLKLLELDDENLYKYKQGLKTSISIENNKVSLLFKKHKYKE